MCRVPVPRPGQAVFRFRHPVVALFGATLLLLSAASDAVGARACAHHAHSHGEQFEDSATDHHHGPSHDHGNHPHDHGAADAGHAEPDEPDAPSPDCDCGFLCVAVSGPPPVERATAALLPGFEAPGAPRSIRISTDDPVVQPVGIPHLLPFSQAPPVTF
jgi:hypothetical protein